MCMQFIIILYLDVADFKRLIKCVSFMYLLLVFIIIVIIVIERKRSKRGTKEKTGQWNIIL